MRAAVSPDFSVRANNPPRKEAAMKITKIETHKLLDLVVQLALRARDDR